MNGTEIEKKSATDYVETRALPVNLNDYEWWDGNDGISIASGATKELTSTAIIACYRALMDTIGTFPLHLYKRVSDGHRERVSDHPLSRLFQRPNKFQSRINFLQNIIFKLLDDGNAFVFIYYNPNTMKPEELYVINGCLERVYNSATNTMLYVDRVDRKRFYYEHEIIDLKIFSRNGFDGLSITDLVRESIGLNLSQRRYMTKFFENGAAIKGYLKTEDVLDDPKLRDEIRAEWDKLYSGVNRSHRTGLLHSGFNFVPTAVTPADSELLLSYQFSITDLARAFRLPPHIIGDLTRSTNNNIEHQGLEFIVYSLLPYLEVLTQEFEYKLLEPQERDGYYLEFLTDKLLQGDAESRTNVLSKQVLSSIRTPNEARRIENIEPVEGGDELLIPVNMVPLSQVVGNKVIPATQASRTKLISELRAARTKSRLKLRQSYRPIFKSATERLVSLEKKDILKKLRATELRDKDSFADFINDYYGKLPQNIRRIFQPAIESFVPALIDSALQEAGKDKEIEPREYINSYLDAFIARYVNSHRGQMLQLLNGEQPANDIEERLNEWEEKQGDKTAENETNRIEGYITTSVWAVVGITLIRWNTSGSTCPLCASLEGQVVGVKKAFKFKGDTVENSDGSDMEVESDVLHAPLHRGCNCYVTIEE